MDPNYISISSKPLICIYTNKEKNEFTIGLKEDETFRAAVDAFENTLITNDIDWQEELKKWIVAAKKDKSIFLEIDLGTCNEAGERRHKN
jgi:hypothetical protein